MLRFLFFAVLSLISFGWTGKASAQVTEVTSYYLPSSDALVMGVSTGEGIYIELHPDSTYLILEVNVDKAYPIVCEGFYVMKDDDLMMSIDKCGRGMYDAQGEIMLDPSTAVANDFLATHEVVLATGTFATSLPELLRSQVEFTTTNHKENLSQSQATRMVGMKGTIRGLYESLWPR